MESSGSVPSAIAPKCAYEEMASTAEQRLMLTKSESEARFIAGLVIERAGEQADRAHLAKLIEHGLHEMRSRLFPRRDDGDFADEINDRRSKRPLKTPVCLQPSTRPTGA